LLARKREKATEFTTGKYGLTYDDFLALGKDKLPNEVFRDATIRISTIDLRAEFIIVGFPGGQPLLCQTTADGQVNIREEFAVIGEGAVLATAALLQRAHMDTSQLDDAVYNVYEAKKLAESVPSVGETTSLIVLTPNGGWRIINDQGEKFLEAQYRKFGPKSAIGLVPFDPAIHLDKE
jgi:hypothetical protein